jgi:hypothetical protein
MCCGAREPTPVPVRTCPPPATAPPVVAAASPPLAVAPPAVEAPVLALTSEHLHPSLGQLVPPVAAIRAWLIDSRNDDSASVDSDVDNEWEIRDRMKGAHRYYYFSAGRLFFNWCVVNVLAYLPPLTHDRASAERLNIRDYINEDRPRLAITDCLEDAIFQAFGMKFRRGEDRLMVRAYENSLLVKSFYCNTTYVRLSARVRSPPLTSRTGTSASSLSIAST